MELAITAKTTLASPRGTERIFGWLGPSQGAGRAAGDRVGFARTNHSGTE
ncbi:hypothetical protein [Glutamicibacter sp. NPDC087344]